MSHSFPAILVGGPPHSGKSVLTYLLSQRLRAAAVEHFVLRACPDGEGDWSYEAPPATVRLLRTKGEFSGAFVDRICRALERRHLPLLVDVGGRPTPDQERIFDHCTHAVLVAPDLAGLAVWRELAARHGLIVIAELVSTRAGVDSLAATAPVLRGEIAHLERAAPQAGPAVAALTARLAALFDFSPGELQRLHLGDAPCELAVAEAQLATAIRPDGDSRHWAPDELPAVLDYLPPAESLALYGRGPGWLYASVALHCAPAQFFKFDPLLGWVTPTRFTLTDDAGGAQFDWAVAPHADFTWLTLHLRTTYLDYAELRAGAAPICDPQQGVVVGGKIPQWLLAGVCLAYRHHPWVGVEQASAPNRGHSSPHRQAVVVYSREQAPHLGQVMLLG
jgi:CRISPR-associated protein Csx3